MDKKNYTEVDVDASETHQEVAQEVKVKKLPEKIYLKTAGGQYIIHTPIDMTHYQKDYYNTMNSSRGVINEEAFASVPSHGRTVKLPVSYEGIQFTTVPQLFEYLCAKRGYSKF